MRRNSKVVLAILAVILIPCLLQATFAYGDDAELSSINNAIREKKANWVAGETSISKLTPAQRKKRVGLVKPLIAPEENTAVKQEQAFLAAVAAPASFDWRSASGTYEGNFVTPIRDQGNCGSCWAFCTVAALESQVLMGNNTPGVNLNLSEQLLLSCSSAGNCEQGGYIDDAANYVTSIGLPLETCFPYTATNNTCIKACAGWTDSAYRINGWHWVATTRPTVEGLKSALVTYGPLVTTMDVYADFYAYTSGIYSRTTGTYEGGHAVLLVGYNDTGQYFIVKNSWGTGWGESGYFRIAYGQLNSVVWFGQYTIADEGYDGDTPQPACTHSITPTSKIILAAGATRTITVSTQSDCSWTAVSNVDWITITKGRVGTGNNTVRYKVAPNTGPSQRTGTLTIAGQTFTVTQRRLLH